MPLWSSFCLHFNKSTPEALHLCTVLVIGIMWYTHHTCTYVYLVCTCVETWGTELHSNSGVYEQWSKIKQQFSYVHMEKNINNKCILCENIYYIYWHIMIHIKSFFNNVTNWEKFTVLKSCTCRLYDFIGHISPIWKLTAPTDSQAFAHTFATRDAEHFSYTQYYKDFSGWEGWKIFLPDL